jgi:hypothetical protein
MTTRASQESGVPRMGNAMINIIMANILPVLVHPNQSFLRITALMDSCALLSRLIALRLLLFRSFRGRTLPEEDASVMARFASISGKPDGEVPSLSHGSSHGQPTLCAQRTYVFSQSLLSPTANWRRTIPGVMIFAILM